MTDDAADPWPTELRLHKDRKTLTVAFDNGPILRSQRRILRVKSPSAEVQGIRRTSVKPSPKEDVAILEVLRSQLRRATRLRRPALDRHLQLGLPACAGRAPRRNWQITSTISRARACQMTDGRGRRQTTEDGWAPSPSVICHLSSVVCFFAKLCADRGERAVFVCCSLNPSA